MRRRAKDRLGLRGEAPTWRPWWLAVGTGTAAAAVLGATNPDDMERYLGPIPPVVGVPALGAAGYGALRFLERRGFWTHTRERWRPGAFPIAVAATIPFGVAAIAADLVLGFPEDMNVDWPSSLLFYPTIALAAEVAFHLLPLAGLTWATRSRFTDRSFGRRTAGLIAATAAVEPLFQVFAETSNPWFVAPHVYLIGLVQLALLRRYGYVPMVAFRLAYYLIWHIAWGAVRIPLLFD